MKRIKYQIRIRFPSGHCYFVPGKSTKIKTIKLAEDIAKEVNETENNLSLRFIINRKIKKVWKAILTGEFDGLNICWLPEDFCYDRNSYVATKEEMFGYDFTRDISAENKIKAIRDALIEGENSGIEDYYSLDEIIKESDK